MSYQGGPLALILGVKNRMFGSKLSVQPQGIVVEGIS